MSINVDSSPEPGAPSFLARAVRNFLFSSIGTVGTFVIAFLFAGLTIRYLGEARAGYFMAIAALTGLNAFLGDFGLGTPAVRRVATLNAQRDFSTARKVVGSVMTASFFSALLIALPVMLLFPIIFEWAKLDTMYRADAFWATIFLMGGFVLTQVSNPWRATFNALERYGLISGLDTVFGMLTGLLGIAILMILPTMAALAAVRFGVILCRFLVSAYYVRKLIHGPSWPTWAWGEIRPMLGFGGWVYLGAIGRTLLQRIDRLVLITFLGSSALPFYEVPQRIYGQVHGALARQSQFLFPMLASYGEAIAVQARRLDDRLRWFIALASGAAYTVIALIGPDLLGMIVGHDFGLKVKLPVYLMCVQGFFQAQDIVPYYESHAAGFGKPNSVVELTQGVLVVLTAFLLIPQMGYLGASVAQLWIVLMVVLHSIWVRSVVMRGPISFGWMKAYISPFIMIGAWIGVTNLLIQYNSSAPFFYLAVILGGLFGLSLLILLERYIFIKENRWPTLQKVILFPFRQEFQINPARQSGNKSSL